MLYVGTLHAMSCWQHVHKEHALSVLSMQLRHAPSMLLHVHASPDNQYRVSIPELSFSIALTLSVVVNVGPYPGRVCMPFNKVSKHHRRG